MTVKMPIPPDAVIQNAGFHAVQVSLDPVDEEFFLVTPKLLSRLKEEKQKVYWYPNEKTPLWVTFKFKYEVEAEATETTADVHLSELFTSLSKEPDKK